MNEQRLDWYLENWSEWMRKDSLRLGYPSQSLGFASGGASSDDTFDHMCEAVDLNCARVMNGMIDSIKWPYRLAINHVWLKTPHFYPTQAMDYDLAREALIELAIKRKVD
jgi:hypothetical protein